LIAGILVDGEVPVRAHHSSPTEYEIKVAFVYNFVKFVEWPAAVFPRDDTPIQLCIIGEDPLVEAIKILEGQAVQGRRITVRCCDTNRRPEHCQIALICSSERNRLPQILALLKDTGALTIGDMEGFAQAGGMISLIKTGNKVHFEVNVDAAHRAQLHISSQLLSLAKIVKEK
jgi:hypothetical protein